MRHPLTPPDQRHVLPDLTAVVSTLGQDAELESVLDKASSPSHWIEAAYAYCSGDLVRAADIYTKIGSAPDEAYAHLWAAHRLIAEGRHAHAHDQLKPALAFFHSVRATRYLTEGEALRTATA